MYSDFHQNRICRSVKTVHTNLFAQYRKLHKFATTNSNFEKKIILEIHHHKTYVYINFHQNQVKTQVMTVPTRYLLPRKEIIDTDGRHDGRTDRQTYTDKRTDGQTNVHGQTDTHTPTNRRTNRRTNGWTARQTSRVTT